MASWQDSGAQLGAEIEAAKAIAVDAFLSAPAGSPIGSPAAVTPVLSRAQRIAAAQPLSLTDVAKLMKVVWGALGSAVTKHIGPVSSDGSVTFSALADADGVPQLNIRALGSGGSLLVRPLDTVYSPVACYQFTRGGADGLLDVSGNGFHLSLAGGTAREAYITPHTKGFLFDGSTALKRATFESALALVGDMSLLWMGMLFELPTGRTTVISHRGDESSEASTMNALYGIQQVLADSFKGEYISEHGAGVNDGSDFGPDWIVPGVPVIFGFRRQSNVVQGFCQGVPIGSPIAITAPTGGELGRLYIGAGPGTSGLYLPGFRGVVGSVAIYNRALTDAEFVERFNYCISAVSGGGGATPTGTGWRHVTGGVEDGAATTPSAADVGALPATDPSVTNARTPTVHASSHATGGSDPVTVAESQVTGLTGDLSTLATAISGKLSATDPSVTNARSPTAHASTHATGGSDPITVTKAQVGLGNVTNDAQVKRTEMGAASGVATLDGSSLILPVQLPAPTLTSKGAVPAILTDLTKFLRADGTYQVPLGAAGTIVDSQVPVDANTQAAFPFNEAQGSTTFVNAIAGAGDLTVMSGTAYPNAFGLRGKPSLHIEPTTAIKSGTTKWEYQTFTLHFWVQWSTVTSATSGDGYLVAKLAFPGAYTDPYRCLSISANATNFDFEILKVVSPRTYINSATRPLTQQLLLWDWIHIALTFDATLAGGFAILYVNGVEWSRSAAQTGVTVQYSSHGEWVVGFLPTRASSATFNIQDLRIENTVRSAAYLLDYATRGYTRQTKIVTF